MSTLMAGCGLIVGESFEGYSKENEGDDVGGADPGQGGDAATEGGAGPNGGRGGVAGTNGGRGGAGDAAGAGGAPEGGQSGATSGGAGAGGEGGVPGTSCPPAATTLITDLETATSSDPSYANLAIVNVPSGIRASGFYCGATPWETGETEACGSPGFRASSLSITMNPDEVHCGQRALKAVANGTPKLIVSLDLDAAFTNAADYAGIRLWAKGTGPFVPGITNGGDWYGLPDLDPDEWQEYSLRWSDLAYPPETPWEFDGNLAAASNYDGHKLAFQVWDVNGDRNDYTLIIDDLSFLPW